MYYRYQDPNQVHIDKEIKRVMKDRKDNSLWGCIIGHDYLNLQGHVIEQYICTICGLWKFKSFRMK